MAVLGIVLSIFGFWIASLTANEFELDDIEKLVEKITRENYIQSRRSQATFNKKEIEKVLADWFSDKFGIEKTELTRDAKFV